MLKMNMVEESSGCSIITDGLMPIEDSRGHVYMQDHYHHSMHLLTYHYIKAGHYYLILRSVVMMSAMY